jgi:hypothetical protein
VSPHAGVHYLWPENEQAWHCWLAVQTQWRVGMSGVTGLDYAAVRAQLDEEGIEPGPERRELWACLRAAERAVLDYWDECAAADARAAKPAA